MARKKEKSENSGLKKLVIFLAILVIAIPASAFGYFYFKLNSIHDSEADESILNNTDYKSEKGITNILLVGTDARPGEKSSRSDSMMILTVDTKNKALKLTSLARDTYADIPGHGKQKLTHAYAYGGINLLTQTIEKTFELDIQNYAIVDFLSFMDIVDTLGGVEVDVQKSEINELNKYIKECYNFSNNPNKGSIQYINNTGVQRLNGYQTLAYSRIRYNDSAFERDNRQREVIQALVNSLKEYPVSKYTQLLDTILPYIKTNMRPTEIISLATKALSIGDLSIKQMEFPITTDGLSTGGIINKSTGWVLQFDPSSLSILHDFIFNNIPYESKE